MIDTLMYCSYSNKKTPRQLPGQEARDVKRELQASSFFRTFRKSDQYEKNLLTTFIIPYAPKEGLEYFRSLHLLHLTPLRMIYRNYIKDIVQRIPSSFQTEYDRVTYKNELGIELEKVIQSKCPTSLEEVAPFLSKIKRWELKLLLSLAVKVDHLKAVKAILPFLPPEPGEDGYDDGFCNELLKAAENGNLPVLTICLEFSEMIPTSDITISCERASRNGHLEVVKALLPFANRFSRYEDFGVALKFAAEKGHISIIEVLLENRKTVFKDFHRSFSNAFSTGNLLAMETLLTVLSEVKPEDLTLAVRREAGEYFYGLKFILKNCGKLILQEDYEEALEIAAQKRRFENMILLLSFDREISEKSLKLALRFVELEKPHSQTHNQIIQLIKARLEKFKHQTMKESSSSSKSGHLNSLANILYG